MRSRPDPPLVFPELEHLLSDSRGLYVLTDEEQVYDLLDRRRPRHEVLDLDMSHSRPIHAAVARMREQQPRDLAELARGVRSQIIRMESTIAHDDLLELQIVACRGGQQARTLSKMPYRMVILDRVVAVISRLAEGPGGLIVTSPLAIAYLLDLYQFLWGYARPLVPSSPTLAGQVAELLFEGLTDAAMARRIGVGERTVTRVVARLMEQHSCRTRFQLGAALITARYARDTFTPDLGGLEAG